MATATRPPAPDNLAEMLKGLGNIPLGRIRWKPYPGTATLKDVIAALKAPRKRLCELVDGVLVEKVMGLKESYYAGIVIERMNVFLRRHDLGFVTGEAGALEIMPGLIRIPDVSFISWGQLASREVPDEAVADLVPDLAVEIISKGNTPAEMQRKLQEYFEAGVQLVWFIYPKTQTAEAYTSPADCRRVGKNQALTGGDVLPGFKLPLKTLFQRPRPPRQ
jgi:Uma2 family endonuclease